MYDVAMSGGSRRRLSIEFSNIGPRDWSDLAAEHKIVRLEPYSPAAPHATASMKPTNARANHILQSCNGATLELYLSR